MYNKRKMIISAITTALILLVGMVIFQKLSSQKESTITQSGKPTLLRKVKAEQMAQTSVPNTIQIDGRLAAYEKVDLSAKVNGILEASSRSFKKGMRFGKGDLLFKIDDREARFNLLAQRSSLLNAITQMMPDLKFDIPSAYDKWLGYIDAYDIDREVPSLPNTESDREKYYVASKNIYTLYYNIKSLESRLADYKVYAPFSGVLSEALTYPGALVTPGARLGTLINTGRYELESPVAAQDLEYIKSGQHVTLYTTSGNKSWKGTVSRISSVIDAATQMVPIYISVSGDGLKEGMYLKGAIDGKTLNNAVKIAKQHLVDQSSVFVLSDSTLMKKDIEIIKIQDDYIFTPSLQSGEWLITDVITGLYDGQKVIPIK